VYVNVYRFAVYVYGFWAELEVVRTGQWRSKLGVGVAIGIGIEGRGMGFVHEKPGTVTVLAQLGSEV
jgi:hypothetical protein